MTLILMTVLLYVDDHKADTGVSDDCDDGKEGHDDGDNDDKADHCHDQDDDHKGGLR